MPTEGVILSGILEGKNRRVLELGFHIIMRTHLFYKRNRTVTGWRAGESRLTSAEGESGKLRISQAKGQR